MSPCPTRIVPLFACCSLFVGCSLLHESPVKSDIQTTMVTPEPAAAKRAPILLSLKQEEESEGALLVRARLEALTDLQTRDFAISALGLSDNVVVEKVIRPLPELVHQPEFRKGELAEAQFLFQDPRVNSYQVQLSWGDDAAKLLHPGDSTDPQDSKPTSVPQAAESPELQPAPETALPQVPVLTESNSIPSIPVPSGTVALLPSSIEIETLECSNPPCDQRLILETVLHNGSDQTVVSAVLGLGIYWVNEGQNPKLPEDAVPLTPDEEQIDLEQIHLPSGGEKRLRLKVDRDIPVIPGGRFLPHVRLVSTTRSN